MLVRRHRPLVRRLALVLGVALVAGCEAGPPAATPEPRPGTAGVPREINLITKDDEFVPKVVDLFPGETVVFHVVNGGLAIHEAVIGDMRVQNAWEEAEAATVGAPPGPTPVVSVRPELAGLRAVVQSGERVDLQWTVPADRSGVEALVIGCHIPGHWDRGMRAAVRVPAFAPAGSPSVTGGTLTAPSNVTSVRTANRPHG